MAAKSETRRVLELMSMDDLREAIDHYDLQRARSHDESVSRLVRKIGSSLDALVSNEGPFSLGVWQDLVEDHLNGWSRDSWAELREEIRFCLEHPDLVELRNEVGEFSVSEVRANPEALILAAQVFDCQPEKLLSALGGRHGNTLLINIDDELRREVRRRKPRAPKNAEKNIPAVTKTVPQPVVSPAVETVPLFPQVPPTVGVLPTAGETINGRWKLDKLLGHGGFGLAFSARDSYVPDVPVVLKFGRDDEGQKSLENEYQKARHLRHPNVCRYVHIDQSAGHGPFIVMDHAGGSLEERCREPVPWLRALAILRNAAAGVDYLHGKDIVHGDISTGNILLDDNDIAQISDFGISAYLRAVSRTDGRHTRVATNYRGANTRFSAPETLARRPVPASDQHSLALVLCALLQGTASFAPGINRFDALSEDQNAAIERALARDHRARFASCTAFVDALTDRNTDE